MLHRFVHSSGIVVCEEGYLKGMWDIQHAEDAGERAHRDLGQVAAIISMVPYNEQKYSRCLFCEDCTLIILRASDAVPPNEVPRVAK